MSTITISDEHWSKIRQFLRDNPRVYVGDEAECRRFLEAVLLVNRSGAQWRLLPPEYGKWNSVDKRFARWCEHNIWEQMLQHFANEPDIEYLIVDSTIVRASVCCWSAQKNGGQAEQVLGRSRGGFSTKIHISVDGLGNPLRFLLSAGQRHDMSQAEALLAGLLAVDYVIGDRSYDASELLEIIVNSGAVPAIPSHPRRAEQRKYDKHLYKERHLVECLSNKIKHFRRVFSRFDKLASRYLGFLNFTGALIWLR